MTFSPSESGVNCEICSKFIEIKCMSMITILSTIISILSKIFKKFFHS